MAEEPDNGTEQMILVAKSVHKPSNPGVDYVEKHLPAYRAVLSRESKFAYSWSFSPDRNAINAIHRNLPFWLYLIGEPWFSPLRTRIVEFFYRHKPVQCPTKWLPYCISEERGISVFPDWLPIHIWFLVDQIEELKPEADVRDFAPYFDHKYKYYNVNNFGIMQ